MKRHISQDRLKELLHYDPVTGHFTWKVRTSNRIRIGDRGGSLKECGRYRQIKVLGVVYLEHRLAWFYMTGELPDYVDHDNTDGTDNRWDNLRKCTQTQNMANTNLKSFNKTGYKGVFCLEPGKKWKASIKLNGKTKHLGIFDSPEMAHEFWCLAADMIYGEFANHGTSQ
jgi:hypothetical protein